MNAYDLNEALTEPASGPAAAPAPGPVIHIADAVAVKAEHALAMARYRYGALNDDGSITCIKCEQATGQLPSLCCPACLHAHRMGRR